MPNDLSPRLLAPLALVVCFLAVLVVVQANLGDDQPAPPTASTTAEGEDGSTTATGSSTTPTETSGASTTSTTSTTSTSTTPSESTYTVQPGDTLGGIAEETGVSVERLQELNPDADPQSLRTGQELRLAP